MNQWASKRSGGKEGLQGNVGGVHPSGRELPAGRAPVAADEHSPDALYFKDLSCKGKVYFSIWTKFTLTQAQSKQGNITYAKIQLQAGVWFRPKFSDGSRLLEGIQDGHREGSDPEPRRLRRGRAGERLPHRPDEE